MTIPNFLTFIFGIVIATRASAMCASGVVGNQDFNK